ncbi:hypothetical protein LEP1GSC170_4685 [Leptospira interrogans serovar Bataviae str. HAI135]|nr:hypothetical protein LEP1GSC170_4685 [Leptospira interrogans serovar Bataviae str. HAI135]
MRISKPIESKISSKKINFFKKSIKFKFLKNRHFLLKLSKNNDF